MIQCSAALHQNNIAMVFNVVSFVHHDVIFKIPVKRI